MTKIAIHHRPGSFSEHWIEFCKKNSIKYKIVNAFDNDIIPQVIHYDLFLWHHHHAHYKDVLTAKRILFALEHAGIRVFPNFRTGWHFDDKVAQKYLLEAINAPLVPSYVFYDREEALDWARNTIYPKVFKLKGGAGAANVKLVQDYKSAKKLINQAFTKGFPQFNAIHNLHDRFNKFRVGNDTILGVGKAALQLVTSTDFSRIQPPDRSYIYFQDFIPNNITDFRIKIVADKCWGFQRKVRYNDFRASGSGDLLLDKTLIPQSMLKTAFETYHRLGVDSIAFDFVVDRNFSPLIIEISYGFGVDPIELTDGYWDSDLQWHPGPFNPYAWMIEKALVG